MSRQNHGVDHKINGHEMQMVEVKLDPGETVIADAGVMNCMEDIVFEVKMGVGSDAVDSVSGKLSG